PTFTLVNPSPIGVVTGPFNATLFRRIESISSGGSALPVRSNASTPATWRSHSIDTPVALMMWRTASVTSGPMPSPGMSVIVWVLLTHVPSQQDEAEAHVDDHQRRRGLMQAVEA